MCAKHNENPTMLSKVTAKNVGDVFLRHTVDVYYHSQGSYVLSVVCFAVSTRCLIPGPPLAPTFPQRLSFGVLWRPGVTCDGHAKQVIWLNGNQKTVS